MARKKKRAIQAWIAPAGTQSKNFARVFDTLLKHKAYISLPFSARQLYIVMLQASAGSKTFHLSESEFKSYGFSVKAFHNAKNKLIQANFITIKTSGRLTRTANTYEFKDSCEWTPLERQKSAFLKLTKAV